VISCGIRVVILAEGSAVQSSEISSYSRPSSVAATCRVRTRIVEESVAHKT